MKHKLTPVASGLILAIILALVSTFAWTTPALAQGPVGDQVVFGDNLVLKAEEKIEGDVVVFGGNVTMPPASEIKGDLVIFGGNADIEGTVTGDIGMIGGHITLGETAVVEGDIGMLGGHTDIAEGARVVGDVQQLNRFGFGEGEGFTIPPIPPLSPTPPVPPVAPDFDRSAFSGWSHRVFGFFRSVVEAIAILLALAVISWLVVAFMPEQMKTVGDTLSQSAPFSFGVGLVTTIVAGVIGGVFFITICLAFIPILGFILLAIATLFGWVVAGQLIGERLLIASGRPYPNLVGSTLVGVTALTTVALMPVIGEIPCIGALLSLLGFLLGFGIAMAGLGAVILTRFGTQPYPPELYPAAGPSPSSPAGPFNPLANLERTEAELRAKIDAALAEADAAAPPTVELSPEEPEQPAAPPRPKRARKPKPAETEPSPEAPSPEADEPGPPPA